MRLPFADRFRRMAANASGLVSTRLALFSLELQEEIERQIRRLTLLFAVFMFGALALVFASLVILIFAWQHGHLLVAAACMAAVCAAIALGGLLYVRQSTRLAPQPFAQTLAELKRDEASLRGDDALAMEETPAEKTRP